MKTFLIFDSNISDKDCSQLKKNLCGEIDFFSLTSDCCILDALLKKLSAPTIKMQVIDSAKIIYKETKEMQKTIHEWSAVLGCYQLGGRTLKEWFLLPDRNISSWWFGLLSEKNTNHTNIFFKIAQVNAIERFLQKNKYDRCFIVLSDKKQEKILQKMIRRIGPAVSVIAIKKGFQPKSAKQIILQSVRRLGGAGIFLRGLMRWVNWLRHSIFTKRALGAVEKRLCKNNETVIISYFPNVSVEDANKGVLNNKYWLPLQHKLKELGKPISWIMMPVPINGYTMNTAVLLAKKFLNHGENICLVEEFFSLPLCLKGILWWLRQAFVSIGIYAFIDKDVLTLKLTQRECLPYIKHLWQLSFLGHASTSGIIYYLIYLNIFKSMKNIKDCIYFGEMQTWEKAFNAAKKCMSPSTRTLGFQHTIVEKNNFKYFYHPDDLVQNNNAMDMPLPDLFVTNGRLTHTLLSESAFDNLYQAEAIRQLYLKKVINKPYQAPVRPMLLVAGVSDPDETKSIIRMVHHAFSMADTFDIVFKAYPSTPIEKICIELGIDVKHSNYKIVDTEISKLLEQATVVFVSSGTVAMEAVAFKKPLIIPLFSDSILMNPVIDIFEGGYFLVSTADELKDKVESNIFKKNTAQGIRSKKFIEHYWNLNETLPLWTSLIIK